MATTFQPPLRFLWFLIFLWLLRQLLTLMFHMTKLDTVPERGTDVAL